MYTPAILDIKIPHGVQSAISELLGLSIGTDLNQL